jgi:hypothetical protein
MIIHKWHHQPFAPQLDIGLDTMRLVILFISLKTVISVHCVKFSFPTPIGKTHLVKQRFSVCDIVLLTMCVVCDCGRENSAR